MSTNRDAKRANEGGRFGGTDEDHKADDDFDDDPEKRNRNKPESTRMPIKMLYTQDFLPTPGQILYKIKKGEGFDA